MAVQETQPIESPVVGPIQVHANLDIFLSERLRHASLNVHSECIQFMERYVVTRVLRYARGNQSLAAAILGITRGCLRKKIRSLGISIEKSVVTYRSTSFRPD